MAGIGVQLNRIFEKNTITSNLVGAGYCIVITIAPILLIILNVALMMRVVGFSAVGYAKRELFVCTFMYISIFALLTTAPFNVVLSKYMADTIYEERYDDILPCFHLGLLCNTVLSCALGIPFCLWEYLVGKVDAVYVFTGFCGYIALIFAIYSMLYLTGLKDFQKIVGIYFLGMLVAFVLSIAMVYVLEWEPTYSMLLALTLGLFLIACMEYALIQSYFRGNSKQYRKILSYFKRYGKLLIANSAYYLGLFIHNFVFWGTNLRIVVANSFITAEPYDMASCLAMFTNISASVIFIASIEMHFHERYKQYSEAVIGGRWADIEKAKKRMFGQLSRELMNLTRVQFIVSITLYFVLVVTLPRYGFSGMVMRIYPSLAAGYFVLFILYAAMLFLYYFDDLTGSMWTSICFLGMTLAGSIFATTLSEIWYGMGLFIGAFAGWCAAYQRLRWMEKNLDFHIFCKGELLKRGKGKKPSEKVYEKYPKKKKKRLKLFGGYRGRRST